MKTKSVHSRSTISGSRAAARRQTSTEREQQTWDRMAEPAHRKWLRAMDHEIEWNSECDARSDILNYYRAKSGRKVSDDTAYWLYYIRERDALFAMTARSKQKTKFRMVMIEE
jgi:hypothetical protein